MNKSFIIGEKYKRRFFCWIWLIEKLKIYFFNLFSRNNPKTSCWFLPRKSIVFSVKFLSVSAPIGKKFSTRICTHNLWLLGSFLNWTIFRKKSRQMYPNSRLETSTTLLQTVREHWKILRISSLYSSNCQYWCNHLPAKMTNCLFFVSFQGSLIKKKAHIIFYCK